MKKTILTLCITTILSISSFTHAETLSQEQLNALNATIAPADYQEDEREDHSESFRTEVERLYPQYIKVDREDSLYSSFFSSYENRQVLSPYFGRSAQYLALYQSDLAKQPLRKINPDLSKLDALLYADLTKINLELEQIQKALAPYIVFNQTILNTIKFDQPYPLFTEKQARKYRNALDDMNDIDQQQQKKLVQLIKLIDQYQDKLDQFGSIVSKRVRKQHQENIDVLNNKALIISHYLDANIQAYEPFTHTFGELDDYAVENMPIYAKQYQRAAETQDNLNKVNALFAVIPNQKRGYTQREKTASEQQIDTLLEKNESCTYLWREDDLSEMEYAVEKPKQQFIQDCNEQKAEIKKFYDQHVFVEAVPQQIASIDNINSMGDFHRYGDELYYTETEKNAVYRFNLKTLKEELIYQHPLAHDESGCDHNMCRGVGATDVVLSRDGKIAYVASLDYDQVFAIDLATKQVLQTFKVERYPRKLLLDQKGENLFVYNGVGNSISQIRLKTGKIKTVALPQNYQEHFCREIGMSFEPDQKAIRILGDWSNHPYIYMNVNDLSFYELKYDIPEKVLYQIDPYRSAVEFYRNSTMQVGIYDIRVAQIVSLITVEPDAFKTEVSEDDYSSYLYRYSSKKTTPILMGYLNNDYLYYVEHASFDRFGDLNRALQDNQLDIYLLNLVDQHSKETDKVTLKLPAKPQKIELLDNGKILILLPTDYMNDENAPAQVMIIDPKDPVTQQVLQRNKTKLLGHSKLEVVDLDFND